MALSDYFTGIQHVGIPTDDLEKTIKFYKTLGFTKAGQFKNGKQTCAFMKYNNIMIETWSGDPVTHKDGAINHFAMNCTDAEKAFKEAKKLGLHILSDKPQVIPTYWDNGIKFFHVLGPNHEHVEFCQIL
ncbi:lactoylglutathione lyase [Philodulcilactobacillus myokoensis]|uniref:Lactoylglutathione lyase n=1 Tax=Philodulcilactobacillus myokoensis TaxID=2929573 RepID=A0A9W6AZW0_9LACO|nr:VOC family protein [Philodulcilactobacillus myokoensis]GLB46051.1 lactoylglutathione lyase [Philodulcilactobacillus myokoensis]